jgi:hypothetical protein
VLNVSVRERLIVREAEKHAPAPYVFAQKVFTKDRLDMFAAISDVLAVILTSANTLGNPSGPWARDRLW